MAEQQLPEGDWWKWALGIVAAAGAVYAGVVVGTDLAKPMPWEDGVFPKQPEGFEGLELAVLGDELGYWVVVYEAAKVVNSEMRARSYRFRTAETELKKDALAEANRLADEARASGRYKLVRVIHTAKELAGWKPLLAARRGNHARLSRPSC